LAEAHVTQHISISNGQARAQEMFSTDTSLRKFIRLCEAETSPAPRAEVEIETRPARSKTLRKAPLPGKGSNAHGAKRRKWHDTAPKGTEHNAGFARPDWLPAASAID
jgi:hypothetical protein